MRLDEPHTSGAQALCPKLEGSLRHIRKGFKPAQILTCVAAPPEILQRRAKQTSIGFSAFDLIIVTSLGSGGFPRYSFLLAWLAKRSDRIHQKMRQVVFPTDLFGCVKGEHCFVAH